MNQTTSNEIPEVGTSEDFSVELLAHNVKNQLGSMRLFTDLIEVNEINEEVAEYVSHIKTAINNIDKYIDGHVLMTTETLELVNLCSVIMEEVAVVKSHFTGKILVDIKATYLYGHLGQIHSIVANLLKNAAEATEDCGIIKISTRISDGYIQLTIEDNGPGIAPEALPMVCNLTYSTKRNHGKGLFDVYNFSKRHSASLDINFSELGGAKISLRFPIRKNETI